jgi:hypothetical protein
MAIGLCYALYWTVSRAETCVESRPIVQSKPDTAHRPVLPSVHKNDSPPQIIVVSLPVPFDVPEQGLSTSAMLCINSSIHRSLKNWQTFKQIIRVGKHIRLPGSSGRNRREELRRSFDFRQTNQVASG